MDWQRVGRDLGGTEMGRVVFKQTAFERRPSGEQYIPEHPCFTPVCSRGSVGDLSLLPVPSADSHPQSLALPPLMSPIVCTLRAKGSQRVDT